MDSSSQGFYIPELIPMDDYKPKQAKLEASISWLLTKAFGRNIPADYCEPFVDTPQGERCLKLSVIQGLISSEIYCRACRNLFREANLPWQGHSSVIQALSRKGIYVVDGTDAAVTEAELTHGKPFKVDCHLALMDSLMVAVMSEVVTIERVVRAVRKFVNFPASSELPFDSEDALLFWLNKVCASVQHRVDKGELNLGSAAIPLMEDLLKDINDGCCLGVLIGFYCPQALPLSVVYTNEGPGIADSMYNLQLILNFCETYLPGKSVHTSLTDLFYTAPELKPNLLVFLAELFYWLELRPIELVRDVTKPLTMMDVASENAEGEDRPTTAKALKSAAYGRPPLPISNATKRSFQQSQDITSSPDGQKVGMPPPRQPLLPKRLQPRSDGHGDGADDDDDPRQSIRAWEEQPYAVDSAGEPIIRGRLPGSQGRGSNQSQLTNITTLGQSRDSQRTLLANVSIDSEMSLDFTESSVDISEYEESSKRTPVGPIRQSRTSSAGPVVTGTSPAGPIVTTSRAVAALDPSHPDYMKVESVAGEVRSPSLLNRSEPLMLANIKPAKKKKVPTATLR